MAREYRVEDAEQYRMVYHEPHRELEPPEREVAVVDAALRMLREAKVIPHTDYDPVRFQAHRRAVAEQFEIPWTAITPRMQRLLYALNAIRQPANLIAAGIFCGNTFIANAGAAIGPGACYRARNLIGVEIAPDRAQLAERNVRRLDPEGQARILAADAVDVAAGFAEPVDLLYLDADGDRGRGKGIYLEILEACYDRLLPGALVLAHNSFNLAESLRSYLDFVRDPAHMSASVNVILDPEGLEVSAR